jgi:hypothetical protein
VPDSPDLPGNRPLATLRPDAASEEHAFAILAAVARIGQGPQNEIVLDDDTVSTQHARLELADGSWRLTDLDSRNGTYVEGVRLAPGVPTPLPSNSIVAFGAVTLAFRSREDVDPASLPSAPAAEPRAEVRRAGFRLPVWLLLVVLILIAALVVLFLTLGGDAPTAAAPFEVSNILVATGTNLVAA